MIAIKLLQPDVGHWNLIWGGHLGLSTFYKLLSSFGGTIQSIHLPSPPQQLPPAAAGQQLPASTGSCSPVAQQTELVRWQEKQQNWSDGREWWVIEFKVS